MSARLEQRRREALSDEIARLKEENAKLRDEVARAPLASNVLCTPDPVNDMSPTPSPCSTQPSRERLQISTNFCLKVVKRTGRGFQCISSYHLMSAASRRWRHLAEKASTAEDQNPLAPVERVDPFMLGMLEYGSSRHNRQRASD
jgi:hypothetical protein